MSRKPFRRRIAAVPGMLLAMLATQALSAHAGNAQAGNASTPGANVDA